MPIGYDQRGGGGTSRPNPSLDAIRDVLDDWRDQIEDVIKNVFDWIQVVSVQRFATPLERWETHVDERTCPQCIGLDGQVWPVGEGAIPPVHDHCRCRRVPAGLRWHTREIRHWERRSVRR